MKISYIAYLLVGSKCREQGDQVRLEVFRLHSLRELSQLACCCTTNHGGVISAQITEVPVKTKFYLKPQFAKLTVLYHFIYEQNFTKAISLLVI